MREGVGLTREGVWLTREGVWLTREGVWLTREGVWLTREGVGLTREGVGLARQANWKRAKGLRRGERRCPTLRLSSMGCRAAARLQKLMRWHQVALDGTAPGFGEA